MIVLSPNPYLKRHHILASLWEPPLLRPIFQKLKVQEQFDLHIYYQTSTKSSDEELLQERRQYGPGDSLPQKAGRAWNSLLRLYIGNCKYFGIEVKEEDPRPSVKTFHNAIKRKDPELLKRSAAAQRIPLHNPLPGKPPKHSHRIGALVRPDFDVEGFAKALLLLAIHNQEEEAKRRQEAEEQDS